MALEAALKIAGKEEYIIVQDVDYHISQPVTHTFGPQGDPVGGLINFTINSPDPKNLEFHEWVANKTEKKSGSFILPIIRNRIEHAYRYLNFEDAYCVSLREYYSNANGLQMYMHITICASQITWSLPGEATLPVFTNFGIVQKPKGKGK